MVRQAAQTYWSLGYTLIELMVVLAIIGAVSAMTLYGVGASNAAQSVDTAQKGFISDLRAMQNRVDNGETLVSGGVVQEIRVLNNQTYYKINGVDVKMPTGVTITHNVASDFTVCVTDRFLDAFDNVVVVNGVKVHKCAGCTGGIGYICSVPPNASAPASVTLTFKNGSIIKKVTIKGYGMRITEIDSS